MRFSLLATVAAAAAMLALSASPARAASTITVDAAVDTNTSDAVVTLREAMLLAIGGTGGNGTTTGLGRGLSPGESDNVSGVAGAASADTIIFAAPAFPIPPATTTIAIGSQLPALTGGNDTIDAVSPPRGVIVRGTEPPTFDCLRLNSGNNAIKGLQLTDCGVAIWVLSGAGNKVGTAGAGNTLYDNNDGIVIEGAAPGTSVAGNRVGTEPSGVNAHPDGPNNRGISVRGSGNTIGGITLGERNVISSNLDGLILFGGASGNAVLGNVIGTDISGTLNRGNNVGINLSRYFSGSGATNNVIGGLSPGQGNVISGNATVNVFIADAGTSGNTLVGNVIGPDINGSGALMATPNNVQVTAGASGNTIGPRNVISDAAGDSVQIEGAGTNGNVVRGNRIGTNLNGTAPVPNTGSGVVIKLGARLTLIGGTSPGDGNTIAHNGEGVTISGTVVAPNTTENSVRGNSIHSNNLLEINNTVGGNLELLPPIITSTAFGSVSGFACANCQVDIYSDPSTDAKNFEGSVTTAGDGSFTFVNNAPFLEANVTATNTDAAGNTSELSSFIGIDSDGDGSLDPTDSDDDNDDMPDVNDSCRIFPEDYDGHEDADGCPDPDNDADGVCDSGLTSLSCSGSDNGKTAFFAAGHNHTNPTVDCRNTPEDFDAFKDADGCPEPDNDNDGFPDATDQCPGDENVAGPDGVLGSGEDQNHNGMLNTGEDTVVVDGVLTSDDVVLTYEDYDLVLNTDGCHDSPGDDRDGDGYRDEVEALHVGTKADDPCGTDAWPSDFVGTGISANRFDTVDLASFLAPVRRMNTSPEVDAGFDKRWDLVPGTTFGKHINIQDLTATISGASGFPPMFATGKALNRTCVVAP